MSAELAVSMVTAVRAARDNDHRRATLNAVTTSVAAARTLMRSRSAAVRVTAIVVRIPITASTTIDSGMVVPRRIDAFHLGPQQHTICPSARRHRGNAADIAPLQRGAQFESIDEVPMSRALSALALAVVLTACPANKADIAMSEQIIQLGDGLNDLRQENAVLQQQIDSLRLVVAKQDTMIRQMANLAGMPLPR